MSESILNSTKNALMIADDYTVFDGQIIMFINSVFSDLEQLGVGPEVGFQITDATTTWDAFLGLDPRLNNVKTYMFLRVRLLFDPPTTSYQITAFDKQREELEVRMLMRAEHTNWVDPNPTVDEELLDELYIVDGGSA